MVKIPKLVALNRTIIDDIRKEEHAQGHTLTGETERRMEAITQAIDGGLIMEGYAPAHIAPLEDGVSAERIPYNSGNVTGAKTSKYIQGLAAYAQLRFHVNEKEALRIAFAIAKKHEKEGMPTQASYAFSKTGERRKAILTTFIKNEEKYFGVIDEAIEEELDHVLFQEAIEII